jgi:multicomponent Na+:H+ antiporter subunit D
MTSLQSLPPGMILVLGAFLLPLLKGRLQQAALIALPVLSYWHLLQFPGADEGFVLTMTWFDYTLTPIRIDRLSMVWGHVFHLAAFLSALYALRVKDTVQHVAGLSYAGAAIGAAFAGDLITLFVFWELTAVTSVFLIWANTKNHRTGERDEALALQSYKTGMRYMLIQVGSGVLLLAGILIHVQLTGSLAFEHMELGQHPGVLLIFIAFGIKAAFPFLHNWLQDSYPQGTVTGTVFLSAFTTKLAIYALARTFAGESILVPIGAAMTLFPIVYAVIENDLRKVLAYSLNNQLGYMVVGIGIGTELALNGAAAHAFAHIIYKGLLFMAMGAVLYRTGTSKASELGGLYKSMPLTTIFCIVGSLSISGFPLFSGFATKAMTMTAAWGTDYTWLAIVLLIASAGVVDHSGIKIPFFAFFAHDNGWRVKEAPWNMLAAMAIAAAICIGLGVYPDPLYAILPYPEVAQEYLANDVFSGAHIVGQVQLLLFAALAFVVLMKIKKYPDEIPSVNIDSDVLYRKVAPAVVRSLQQGISAANAGFRSVVSAILRSGGEGVAALHRPPSGMMGEPWPSGATTLSAAILLTAVLLMAFL